jgi:UDP-3-O-[3-hydroxymyristoyl] glucosamine N-acyltransferase
MKINARALARQLGGVVEGNGDVEVSGVASISQAGATDVTFAESVESCAAAFASVAGVILVGPGAPSSVKTLIRVASCREAFAMAMTIFHPPKQYAGGIDPSARIGAGVQLGKDVFLGPNVVLGAGVQVGDRTVILANCVIAEGVSLGEDCLLHPSITLYSNVKVGRRVIMHAGCVIGSDGFGYVRKASGIAKVPQIGGVLIEDDVELGANVTIDRATMNSTVIGRGTKIDNQVQIAHNVQIGRNCLIAGQVGISGSVRVGDSVTLGGQVGVVDQVEIGANVVVGAVSLVTKDVPPGQVVWGIPAQRAMDAKRQNAALRRLPAMLKALRARDQPKLDDQPEAAPRGNGD